MKVILLNGSRREFGCTYTALKFVADELQKANIKTEIIHVTETLDPASVREQINLADGLVVGSPVYFASPNGTLIAFLDRLFFGFKDVFRLKPAAAVVSARRAGTSASLDVITKYFSISNMPIVSSDYWCMVHGNTPEEVLQDEEGVYIMKVLGQNMAWMLQIIDAGKKAGVSEPIPLQKAKTNFIR